MKTVFETPVRDKCVLVRVDFNVPLDSYGNVADDTRIVATLPTLEYLLSQNARVIIISHLGRPKGCYSDRLSLKKIAQSLERALNHPINFLPHNCGADIKKAVSLMTAKEIILLDNLRFHQGEESNSTIFAKFLSSLADVFINDAFGAAHLAHASTQGIAQYMPIRAAGLLMQREIEFLGSKIDNPRRPFAVILGGSKISEKIHVILSLLQKSDMMLIGGAMAYTFALAKGYSVGNSFVEHDKVELARKILHEVHMRDVKFLLPEDHLVTDRVDWKNKQLGAVRNIQDNIPDHWQGVDIGVRTIKLYQAALGEAKTILWNGPMGIFEINRSAQGTFAIATTIAHSKALSIIGGGDSIKAIKDSGLADKITFMSTGGGASLAYLQGRPLPAITALS